MYVVIHHQISDPNRFWSTVREATPNLPSGVQLHHCLPNRDGSQAVCVWEADSVERVRDIVEGAVGEVSSNEYFEAEGQQGINLPSGVAAA